MGEARDCYEKECVRDNRCYDDCCDCRDTGGGSGHLIWILIIGYLLLCHCNNNGRDGLFGGLF
jgi:hypothetical protein